MWRRAMAAHSLGDMGSPVAVPALLQLLLSDPAHDVREAAARLPDEADELVPVSESEAEWNAEEAGADLDEVPEESEA